MDINEYLETRFQVQLNWYEFQAQRNKKLYQIFQIGLIIASSLTPVFIAIDFCVKSQSYLVWIPIITSVFVAIFASLLQAFKFQERWLNYRSVAELMKREKQLFLLQVGDYSREDAAKRFVENIESLIITENSKWISSFLDKQNQPFIHD